MLVIAGIHKKMETVFFLASRNKKYYVALSICLVSFTLFIWQFSSIASNSARDTRDVIEQNHPKQSRLRSLWSRLNEKKVDLKDKRIDAKEQFHFSWDFTGYCFDESGASAEVTAPLTSSLIHSFSPYVERESAKRFVDPPHSNIYYANSPAITWRDGKYVTTCTTYVALHVVYM